MFVEYTELLVTMYFVEKMLPHETVEIQGAKKFTVHNMMGASRRNINHMYFRHYHKRANSRRFEPAFHVLYLGQAAARRNIA